MQHWIRSCWLVGHIDACLLADFGGLGVIILGVMSETSFTLLTCVCVGVCDSLVRCWWFGLYVSGIHWACVGHCGARPESRIFRMGGFAIELSRQTHGVWLVVCVCGCVVGGLDVM